MEFVVSLVGGLVCIAIGIAAGHRVASGDAARYQRAAAEWRDRFEREQRHATYLLRLLTGDGPIATDRRPN